MIGSSTYSMVASMSGDSIQLVRLAGPQQLLVCRTPEYWGVSAVGESCASQQLYAITNQTDCEAAAAALGLSYTRLRVTADTPAPLGCCYHPRSRQLRFSTNAANDPASVAQALTWLTWPLCRTTQTGLGWINGGGWAIALNINPSDGHTHGYVGGDWENMSPWPGSSEATALFQDYKSLAVYDLPVNEIMIVNHNDGALNAFKSWRFTIETSVYAAFTQAATTGPQEQTGTCTGCTIPPDCPFMSLAGALKFSDTTGNDGVRLGVVGGNSVDNVAKGIGTSVALTNGGCQADSYGVHLCS